MMSSPSLGVCKLPIQGWKPDCLCNPQPAATVRTPNDTALLRGPTVTQILAFLAGMQVASHSWFLESMGWGDILQYHSPLSRANPTSPLPHLSPVTRAKFVSKEASRGRHAQHMGVSTSRRGCVGSEREGRRRQALQEPWCPPARPHQLQPQPQLSHLLLLLTQTVTLQDMIQVL